MGVILVVVLIVAAIYLCIRFVRDEEAEESTEQIQAERQKAERQRREAAQQKEQQNQRFDETRKAEFLKQLAEMDEQHAIKERERKRREEEKEKRKVYLTDEQRERLEQGVELPRLKDCELMLQRGEIVVFGSKATWQNVKKGEQYEGSVYVTDQRVGFVSDEKGFVLRHSELLAVKAREHGLILHAERGAYSLDLPRPDLMNKALKGLRNGLPIAGMDAAAAGVRTGAGVDSVSAVDGMDGHDFEYFCAELLRKNGFDEAEVTRGSGDQGVDILATKGGVKYAIQCKNYASRLGNTPIQEVNTGKTFYKCHVGVVMTNSTFTPAAEELAASTNVLLWDRKVLDQYIRQAQ